MSLQHIQKNSPRLLPKPAKFEKNPPNGYRVIRKTKCGAGGAGGARSSPIHKQASLAGRLINTTIVLNEECVNITLDNFINQTENNFACTSENKAKRSFGPLARAQSHQRHEQCTRIYQSRDRKKFQLSYIPKGKRAKRHVSF